MTRSLRTKDTFISVLFVAVLFSCVACSKTTHPNGGDTDTDSTSDTAPFFNPNSDTSSTGDSETGDSDTNAEPDTGTSPFTIDTDASGPGCPDGFFASEVRGTVQCLQMTTCAPGQFVFREGSSTTDRVCVDCPDGFFSAAANAADCNIWTVCAAGEYVLVVPSEINNRTCDACPSGTTSLFANADTCVLINDTTDSAAADTEPETGRDSDTASIIDDGGYKSCAEIQEENPTAGSSVYAIDPDGDGVAVDVYCDMETHGGGWTAITIYGMDGRPENWTGGDYPRPGTVNYGVIDLRVFDDNSNNASANPPIANWSIDAHVLWGLGNREILAYVGGTTDDFIYAQLPRWRPDCNFFDNQTVCMENQYGDIVVYNSDDEIITSQAIACTTAHNAPPFENDYSDEQGFTLIDIAETNSIYHCGNNVSSSLGHQDMGRIFYARLSSTWTEFWLTDGVHSHWNESGQLSQPGALFIR